MCDGVTGVPSVVFVTVIVQSMVVLCCVHQPHWDQPRPVSHTDSL